MKHISDLLDIGKDKRCLIVGGGHSVNEIDFDEIPDDVVIIGTNRHKKDYADIIIYYDRDVMKYYREECVPAEYMIGFKKSVRVDNTCPQCTHYYDLEQLGKCYDTGFHALFYADKVFNFTEIYLIGYDYKTTDKSYHYDEQKSDDYKMSCFKKHSIRVVLPEYKKEIWRNKIYNMTKNTDLRVFSYKKLDN